jgi:hypothetical protein
LTLKFFISGILDFLYIFIFSTFILFYFIYQAIRYCLNIFVVKN